MSRIFTYGLEAVGRGKPNAKPTNKRTTASGNEELMVIAAQNGWAPRTKLTMAEIDRMGALEFRYHELFSADAVAAALANETTRPQPREDTRITNTTSGASKEQGERKGYSVRELTYRQIQEMTADETAWHQRFNSDNWKKAFEEEQRRRERRNHIANERIKLMYEGHSTAEEDEAAIRAAGAFAARTPDFVRNLSNAKIMAEFMQQNGLDGTELSSYRTAFQTLKEQGKLELAKPESADEYYEKHKDVLQDKRVPPIIEARQRQERNTDALTAATSAATARGTVVNVVDYGPQTHGVPPEPDKYSFKQKIRSMSASQIQQRCQDDPAFRKALDNLK